MAAEPREDPLASIIDAILDGRPADWPDAEQRDGLSPDEQQALGPLRVLAAIASVQSPLGFSSVEDNGRFEIEELIGRGASGDVYRGRDTRLDRDVALKIVPFDRPFAGSVLAEARRLARVRHPNVVTIYDVFETPLEGRICMELLSGPTLAQIVAGRRHLPIADVLHIGRCIARALSAIHGAGLVHGDIKPANVVMEDSGRVVVMDFGAGTDLRQGHCLVRTGTPQYMAPEIIDGGRPRPESDIFSLGLLLLYLAAGEPALRAASDRGTAAQAPRIMTGPPHLAEPLRPAVERALQIDPLARFRSAVEFESALTAPASPGRHTLLVALLICVASLCLTAWSVGQRREPAQEVQTERQLTIPPELGSAGDLLPDGSVMAFTTRGGGIAVLDTSTGASRPLVTGDGGAGTVEGVLLRAQDRSVVFGRRMAACDCVELRAVPIDGGSARPLLRTPFPQLQLYSLAADGASVLLRAQTRSSGERLVVADLRQGTVSDGIPVSRTTRSADLSPDGRLIAYDQEEEGAHSDLLIADVATGRTWGILSGAPDDVIPIWTRDGRSLVFSSDRAGSPGLWRLDLKDGQPLGAPTLVQRDMGRFIPLRLAASGSMLFWRTPVTDIEVAPFDEVTGRVGEATVLPVRISGSNTAPCWVSSGEAIVYAAERRAIGARRSVLVIHSLSDGRERELTVPVAGFLEAACSPTANRVLIRGPGVPDDVPGGRVVDLRSGGIEGVYPFPLASQQWSANGQSYYALDPEGLYRVDLSNASRTRIDLGDWQPSSFAVSPDGSAIAAGVLGKEGAAVVISGSAGGSPRVLYRIDRVASLPRVMAWTPDGSRILAVANRRPDKPDHVRLVSLDVGGSGMTDTDLERQGLSWVRIRPDGREITYRTGLYRRTLWLREHILPPAQD